MNKPLLILLIVSTILVVILGVIYFFGPTIDMLTTSFVSPKTNSLNTNQSQKIGVIDESSQIDVFIAENRSTDHLESFLPLTNNSVSYNKLNIIITDTPQQSEDSWVAPDDSLDTYISYSVGTEPTGEINLKVHFNKPVLEKYNWSSQMNSQLLQQLVLQTLISLRQNNSFDSAREESIAQNQELLSKNILSPFIVVYAK